MRKNQWQKCARHMKNRSICAVGKKRITRGSVFGRVATGRQPCSAHNEIHLIIDIVIMCKSNPPCISMSYLSPFLHVNSASATVVLTLTLELRNIMTAPLSCIFRHLILNSHFTHPTPYTAYYFPTPPPPPQHPNSSHW